MTKDKQTQQQRLHDQAKAVEKTPPIRDNKSLGEYFGKGRHAAPTPTLREFLFGKKK